MGKISTIILNRVNKKTTMTPVYLMYTHASDKFIINTNVLVDPKNFDREEGKLKRGHSSAKNDNAKIASCHERLDSILRQAHLNFTEPTSEWVKAKYFAKDGEPNKDNAIDLFEEKYLPWVKSNLKYSTYRQRKVVLTHLKEFQVYIEKELTLKYCVTSAFYNEYCDFLFKKKKMLTDSAGGHIKRIKSFLLFLADNGILPSDIKLKHFKVMRATEKTPIILEREEVEKIKNLNLPEDHYLTKYRDILLFGIKTGLRFSDLTSVGKQHLKSLDGIGYFIEKSMVKTKQAVEIPIHQEVIDIIKKYWTQSEIRLLPKVSGQKFNKNIKVLGELAGINTPTEVLLERRNEIVTVVRPKYMLLSSHTMRRTFISNCVKSKIPTVTIKTFTGHKDLRSFNKYVNVAEKQYRSDIIKEIY